MDAPWIAVCTLLHPNLRITYENCASYFFLASFGAACTHLCAQSVKVQSISGMSSVLGVFSVLVLLLFLLFTKNYAWDSVTYPISSAVVEHKDITESAKALVSYCVSSEKSEAQAGLVKLGEKLQSTYVYPEYISGLLHPDMVKAFATCSKMLSEKTS